MKKKSKDPEKHYSAHQGHVYLQDVIAVALENNSITYVGRAAVMPKGSVDINIDMSEATPMGYTDPKQAFLATHRMLNDQAGLGQCFLGYNPFGDDE